MEKTAVLITCYNRKDKTRACLETLNIKNNPEYKVFLVDDGCTDGTAEMIQNEFPMVNIIKGDGNLFWNQGMRLAFKTALRDDFDFYLWVNDDVVFNEDVLVNMTDAYHRATAMQKCMEIMIVGYTTAMDNNKVTYGGYKVAKSFIPIKLQMVQPNNQLQECDTCNGNCVLIPRCVVEKIGVNSKMYHHSQGDIDYGLTARKAGCKLYLTDFPVGRCEKNDGAKIWNDVRYRAPIKEKKKAMNSVRNRPKNEWKYFTKKFGGKRWFLRYYLPYIKLYISAIISRF